MTECTVWQRTASGDGADVGPARARSERRGRGSLAEPHGPCAACPRPGGCSASERVPPPWPRRRAHRGAGQGSRASGWASPSSSLGGPERASHPRSGGRMTQLAAGHDSQAPLGRPPSRRLPALGSGSDSLSSSTRRHPPLAAGHSRLSGGRAVDLLSCSVWSGQTALVSFHVEHANPLVNRRRRPVVAGLERARWLFHVERGCWRRTAGPASRGCRVEALVTAGGVSGAGVGGLPVRPPGLRPCRACWSIASRWWCLGRLARRGRSGRRGKCRRCADRARVPLPARHPAHVPAPAASSCVSGSGGRRRPLAGCRRVRDGRRCVVDGFDGGHCSPPRDHHSIDSVAAAGGHTIRPEGARAVPVAPGTGRPVDLVLGWDPSVDRRGRPGSPARARSSRAAIGRGPRTAVGARMLRRTAARCGGARRPGWGPRVGAHPHRDPR